MGHFWKRKPPRPAQPPALPLWEYTIRLAFEEHPLAALSDMGRVGWELVSVVVDEDRTQKMFFKRQTFREDRRRTDEWLAEQHHIEGEELNERAEAAKKSMRERLQGTQSEEP